MRQGQVCPSQIQAEPELYSPSDKGFLDIYMLQGICETRKYVYFLKLSVNTRIS